MRKLKCGKKSVLISERDYEGLKKRFSEYNTVNGFLSLTHHCYFCEKYDCHDCPFFIFEYHDENAFREDLGCYKFIEGILGVDFDYRADILIEGINQEYEKELFISGFKKVQKFINRIPKVKEPDVARKTKKTTKR